MTGDGAAVGVALWSVVLAGLAAVTVVARVDLGEDRPDAGSYSTADTDPSPGYTSSPAEEEST
ncbi:hypothetical protein ABZ714_03510 [Streptomyces sp. NPDC006798]|uniref:hypothetical protein n=1 Tax=Streptomyces sp. NPDC006798 TaxID=3155462 RepID=UPI0034007647